MHGFVDLYPVFYGVFGRLDQSHFGLVFFILLLLPQIVQLLDCYPLALRSLLPDLQLLLLSLLVSLPLSLLFLHPEYLSVLGHGKWAWFLNAG